MHLKKSMLLCSLLFAVHLGTFAQTPQDAYTVKYDGNGATSGEMDDHTFAIGVEETTNLDPNSFVRSYNVSFDTQGGDSIADMKADYTFQGWIHEQLLTEITQNMENNWFNISTEAGYDDIDLKLITLSTTDGVTSVSINPKGKTRERLYSQPIFMPAGDYELSFKVCSPTGYQDLTSEWEMRFKCSACDQPQTIYCNDLGLLTKGEEKSAAIIEYYEASNELVERKFTIFANDTTPVYIAINGGNIRDNVRSDFKFADFVLSKDGATSLKYTDKEPTRNIVRENGGVVELKAQWKEASIKLPTPTKEGYTFTFWNTKPDGKGKSYKGGASLKITADTKLYAMWEKGGGSGEGGCPSLNQTTQGKDFWVAFIKNNSDATAMIEYPYGMQVTLASNKACEVTLQNIPIGFSQTVSLGEKESKTIDIPYDDFAIDIEQSQIINKSLQITSTEEISVFTSSYEYHSMDASIVLPTSSWGTEYVVQTYDSWGGSEWTNYQYKPAQVMIIAAEDNTIVEILPSVNIKDHNAKEAFTVELNEGEVYYMKAEDATSLRGFSGTTIVSKNGQNISVIAGNQCAMVPLGSTADVDMLMETMYPVSSWGNRFCFIPSKNGYADILKYTAAGKGAIIYRNGKQIAKLGAYESFEESLRESEGVSFITSSEPIEIFQYMTSNRYLATRTKGGPSMVYLNPIEQGISETVFSTYNFDNEVSEHWMNLLVKSSDVNDITLDGESGFTTFTKVTGNDQYSYATVSLKDGFHSLKSPNAFIATIYGLGNDISYAYSAGSNLYSINDPETITDTICEGFQYVFGGRKYTETGVYLDTIMTASGCEEIAILNLTVVKCSAEMPDNVFNKSCVQNPNSYSFDIIESASIKGVNSMSSPLVGDIDGDGTPEILVCVNTSNSPYYSKDFFVIDGKTAEVKYTITTPEYYMYGQCMALADVDKDGKSELFLMDKSKYIYCYDYQGKLLWKSSIALTDRLLLSIADVNHDGDAEVVCGCTIFNAKTGALLINGTMEANGKGFMSPHNFHVDKYGKMDMDKTFYMYALADFNGDEDLELAAGNTLYKIDITNKEGTEGNQFNVIMKADSTDEIPYWDGGSISIDFDNDGDLDICTFAREKEGVYEEDFDLFFYVWDGQTSELIAYYNVGKAKRGFSIPFSSDLNNDGYPEVVVNTSNGMYVLAYDNKEVGKTKLLALKEEFQETAGFTAFDFNQDGKTELVFRGMTEFYIVDGNTLEPLTSPITAYSGTITEYPVVADVDADGHAEILITRGYDKWNGSSNSEGYLSIYKSEKPGAWGSARKVWNQWTYNSVNINEDLTVPQYSFNISTTFPNGKKVFNSFLQQQPYIDENGNIFNTVADLQPKSDSSFISYNEIEGYSTEFILTNKGENISLKPLLVSYYDEDTKTLLGVDTLKEYEVPIDGNVLIKSSLGSAPYAKNINLVINDSLLKGHQPECDYTNNSIRLSLPTPCMPKSDSIIESICEGSKYVSATGKSYTETGTYYDTLTTSTGCDSLIILKLTVIKIQTTTLSDTVVEGASYQKYGFDIAKVTSNSTTFKKTLVSKDGCDSIVTLNLTVKEKPSQDPDPSVPGTYTVVYDGNGATSGKMDKHVYTIGANETTQLDANQYKKVYNVTFDTQGGSSVDDMQSSCEFAGWLQDEFLTSTTNVWEKTWTNAYPQYTKVTNEDGVNVVNVSTKPSVWERLYSHPVYMPKGNHTVKFAFCSPTGYFDCTRNSDLDNPTNRLKLAVCSTPQTSNSTDANYLTNGTDYSYVILKQYDPTTTMQEKNLSLYSTGAAAYFAFNCGNLRDTLDIELHISPLVLYINGESSAIYNDMANTSELVREETGTVTLKAQWEDKSIVTPFAPAKAGYTFKEWNTKADGTGDSYAAYVEVGISSDTEFYAIWVPEEELEIPTAFTPHSNDGMNDIFMEGYEVYIYDRYGDVITHSNNGWDGTYKGKTATPGVYVYVLIDKKGNSERTIKGTIEIVKAK